MINESGPWVPFLDSEAFAAGPELQPELATPRLCEHTKDTLASMSAIKVCPGVRAQGQRGGARPQEWTVGPRFIAYHRLRPCPARAAAARGAQEQQAAWQALKKATGGNTCWAGNPALSMGVMVVGVAIGTLALTKGMFDLSLGINKYR